MSETPKLEHVIIYTDGAAEPNPGPGGYGVVLKAGKHRKELSGGFGRTTNNRMELLAVIIGLEALSRPCSVIVHSDSKYVVDSILRGSVLKWQKKGWKRSGGERAKNVDLWKRYLDAAAKHRVQMRWVKGHAGIAENERCDELAVAAAQEGYERDEGYFAELQAQSEHEASLDSADIESTARKPKPKTTNAEMTATDQTCRKCGGALLKKPTQAKKHKPGQLFYYEWVHVCSECNTMYLADEAKRMIKP